LNKLDKKDPSVIKNVIFPQFSKTTWNCTSSQPVKVVLASDIHVGSLTFCIENFTAFIKKINQDPSIRYVILTGDLIDGIGVYPRQKFDLTLPDFREQYKLLSQLLQGLRPEIQILLVPGNHDFVSKVEPQVFTQEIKEIFKSYLGPRVHFASNPAYIEVEGIYFYLSHGTGFNPIINKIASFSIQKPALVTEFLAKCRNISPLYEATPIRCTNLVYHNIPEKVNVIHSGHVHHQQVLKYDNERLMVVTGAWQALTPYMDLLGVVPTIAAAVCVNLNDINAYEEWHLQDETTALHSYHIAKVQSKEN
jgi:DNA polymerase II small subunit